MFTYYKDKSLVNLSNSILKYCSGTSFHDSLKELDEVLNETKPTKICLVLLDGFGQSIREKHLSENGFLRSHKLTTISSVFPPTTVAATTALLSGRYPKETCWLGWQQYFPTTDQVVEMFTNVVLTADGGKTKMEGPRLSDLYYSYDSIIDIINKNKLFKAVQIKPSTIDPSGAKTYKEFINNIDKLYAKEDHIFSYCYWPDPDYSMHINGTDVRYIKYLCRELERRLYTLSKKHQDTLFIIISDHSLININFFNINEHKDFRDCLKGIHSVDSRSACFHLKEGKKQQFLDAYEKYYKNYFKLLTKQEIIDQNIFGLGEAHPAFKDCLGDYMLIAEGNYAFTVFDNYFMKATHAGGTKEENLIDVSVIKPKARY